MVLLFSGCMQFQYKLFSNHFIFQIRIKKQKPDVVKCTNVTTLSEPNAIGTLTTDSKVVRLDVNVNNIGTLEACT